MPVQRITLQDDVERLADTIQSQFPGIQTEQDFNRAFQMYLEETLTNGQDSDLRPKVLTEFKKRRPIIETETFKEARGRDFNRDRKKTAKRVTTSVKEYKRVGAQNIDLKGYDTKPRRKRGVFDVMGRVKGKVVFARIDFVKIKSKKVTKYRDKKGRFVSVKR
jgi:hypothetical protein